MTTLRAACAIGKSAHQSGMAGAAQAIFGSQYRAQIGRSIPAADAGLRAELVSAVILGVIVSRHLLKSDGLTGADPEQIVDLLRPCLRSLTRAMRFADTAGRITANPSKSP